MRIEIENDDDELLAVPVSRETVRRLVRFSRAVGDDPSKVAGRLLTELLVDDDFWNAAASCDLLLN